MATPAVASRSTLTRHPNKPKKGEPHRLHAILPGELVALIDRVAEDLVSGGGSAPWAPKASRTDAIKVLLTEALQHRGLLK